MNSLQLDFLWGVGSGPECFARIVLVCVLTQWTFVHLGQLWLVFSWSIQLLRAPHVWQLILPNALKIHYRTWWHCRQSAKRFGLLARQVFAEIYGKLSFFGNIAIAIMQFSLYGTFLGFTWDPGITQKLKMSMQRGLSRSFATCFNAASDWKAI